MKRTIAVVCMALSAIVMGVWAFFWSQVPAESRSLFSQEKYAVQVVSKDEFGDEVSQTDWVEKWTPGLLDVALPIDAVLTTTAIALLIWQLRDEKAARSRQNG